MLLVLRLPYSSSLSQTTQRFDIWRQLVYDLVSCPWFQFFEPLIHLVIVLVFTIRCKLKNFSNDATQFNCYLSNVSILTE